MSSPPLDLPTEVFPNFPALSPSSFVFGDNAGGSQILGACVDALTDFLLCSNGELSLAWSIKSCFDLTLFHPLFYSSARRSLSFVSQGSWERFGGSEGYSNPDERFERERYRLWILNHSAHHQPGL